MIYKVQIYSVECSRCIDKRHNQDNRKYQKIYKKTGKDYDNRKETLNK